MDAASDVVDQLHLQIEVQTLSRQMMKKGMFEEGNFVVDMTQDTTRSLVHRSLLKDTCVMHGTEQTFRQHTQTLVL